MLAERRLERSRNATTAAVPLTEANATAFSFLSATSAREAAAERALVAVDDFCATRFIFNLCGNLTGIVFSSGKLMS